MQKPIGGRSKRRFCVPVFLGQVHTYTCAINFKLYHKQSPIGKQVERQIREEVKTVLNQVLSQMRFRRGLLGSRHAPALVNLGLPQLRLPRAGHFGRRQHGQKTSGRLENKKPKHPRILRGVGAIGAELVH